MFGNSDKKENSPHADECRFCKTVLQNVHTSVCVREMPIKQELKKQWVIRKEDGDKN